VPLLRPDGPQPHQPGAAARPPNWPALLAAALGWSSFNIGLVLVLNFAPALLVARGLAAPEAGQLASLAGWALVVLTPLGGYLAGRHGRGSGQIMFGATLAVPLAEALAGLPPGAWAAAAYLAFGLATGLMAAPLISLPAQVLPPPARAFGMGAFYSLYYLAMAVVPPFAGWARDASGDPAAPLHLAALLLVVAGLAVPLFHRLARARAAGG
jgi:MFS family permease